MYINGLERNAESAVVPSACPFSSSSLSLTLGVEEYHGQTKEGPEFAFGEMHNMW